MLGRLLITTLLVYGAGVVITFLAAHRGTSADRQNFDAWFTMLWPASWIATAFLILEHAHLTRKRQQINAWLINRSKFHGQST